MNDSQLETLAQTGDQQALADLFDRFRARLRRIVDARLDTRLRGRVDPSDVLQEAFIDLAQKLPGYIERHRDSESGISMFVWMRLVTTERVLAAHRKHLDTAARDARRETPQHQVGQSSVFFAEHLISVFGSAENRVLRDEMFVALKLTLESMDPVDHEIITMRCFEELTNSEAAEALGISQNGASSRFVRAMTRLKKQLQSIPGFRE